MKNYSLISTICLAALLLFMFACKKTDKNELDNTQTFKVTDVDGNKYDTVHIGTQVWLKQNLRVTHYRNGDPIENITTNSGWFFSESGAWCCYNNDTSNTRVYGRLYNLYAVQDPRGLCPQGWHTPTEAEWCTLESFLGTGNGGKLKEEGTGHWASPNAGATNSSRFTALPGGKRTPGDASFGELGSSAYFWTNIIDVSSSGDFPRQLSYDKIYTSRACYSPKDGVSVRCIMD